MISLKKIYENNIYMLRKPTIGEDEVDQKELKMGIAVESEHSDDIELAKIIALHHLGEPGNEHYYTKLKKVEKKLNKDKK